MVACYVAYIVSSNEMISRRNARHGVTVEEALDHSLDILVPAHEWDVGGVEEEEKCRLPPDDQVVHEEENQGDEADAVEGAITKERPPRQRQERLAEQGAHADDEEDVEDGWADDGADADVVERDEDADDAGEELRGAATCCHEGGAGHVVRDVQLLDDDVERRHKEFVTDHGQGDEHVDDAGYVEDDGATLALLLREQIRGEQRLRLVLDDALVASRFLHFGSRMADDVGTVDWAAYPPPHRLLATLNFFFFR